jgi:hypothetical protein
MIGSHPTPVEQAEYDREVGAVRSRRGEAAFARGWQEGQALTMDAAIALACREG